MSAGSARPVWASASKGRQSAATDASPAKWKFIVRNHVSHRLGVAGPETPATSDRRTHEPRQASRGGLDGSDGSGWALLAIRDEARRRSQRGGEFDLRRDQRLGQLWSLARQGGETAIGRTHVAFVRCHAVLPIVMLPGTRMLNMVPGMVVGHAVLHGSITRRMVMQAKLACHATTAAAGRAQHGRGHRTPNREQDHQHQQQPGTNRLHDEQASTPRPFGPS